MDVSRTSIHRLHQPNTVTGHQVTVSENVIIVVVAAALILVYLRRR